MTAPLRFATPDSTSVNRSFPPSSSDRASGRYAPSRRTVRSVSASQPAMRSPDLHRADVVDLDWIWTGLLESLPQGVMVVSRALKPIYRNAKAQDLCDNLESDNSPSYELPSAISEVCHRLLREDAVSDRTFVMECSVRTGHTIRISARWLRLPGARDSAVSPFGSTGLPAGPQRAPYLLVFLENCYDRLQEELQIEQKKYDLTEREAEVWMLLRQEYTYQEIAKMLQISLNTVKTHVKNVYAKRRSFQGQETFWCSR